MELKQGKFVFQEVINMAERYIKEYANDCKRKIEENNLMESNVKNKAIAKINKAVKLRDKGLITADEAIKIILERFEE